MIEESSFWEVAETRQGLPDPNLASRPYDNPRRRLPLSLLVSSLQGFRQVRSPTSTYHQSTCRISVCEPGTKKRYNRAARPSSTCLVLLSQALRGTKNSANIGHGLITPTTPSNWPSPYLESSADLGPVFCLGWARRLVVSCWLSNHLAYSWSLIVTMGVHLSILGLRYYSYTRFTKTF